MNKYDIEYSLESLKQVLFKRKWDILAGIGKELSYDEMEAYVLKVEEFRKNYIDKYL